MQTWSIKAFKSSQVFLMFTAFVFSPSYDVILKCLQHWNINSLGRVITTYYNSKRYCQRFRTFSPKGHKYTTRLLSRCMGHERRWSRKNMSERLKRTPKERTYSGYRKEAAHIDPMLLSQYTQNPGCPTLDKVLEWRGERDPSFY